MRAAWWSLAAHQGETTMLSNSATKPYVQADSLEVSGLVLQCSLENRFFCFFFPSTQLFLCIAVKKKSVLKFMTGSNIYFLILALV